MKKFLVCAVLLMAVVPMSAEVAGVGRDGQFSANLKPEVTDLNVDDYYYLATYFHSSGFGAPPFDWCWSQRVAGKVEEVNFRGDWVFCGRANWMMADPFNTWIGPEFYVVAGVIMADQGEIYTMTYRTAAWDADTLEGFGGLTRFFGGTGEFNYALGWTTDRPKAYPPSSWTKSQGAITVLGAGTDDHSGSGPSFEFPVRVPGNIEVFRDEDFFKFETKAGWRYNFGTTLGTLDDSLIRLERAEPQSECYFGEWEEGDGQWDGDGSWLGAFTSPADCTYSVKVIDWGRAGTSGTGTYTLWGEEWLP